MIITLQDTETREISAKIDELHEERGEAALGRVLTLLISTNEAELEHDLEVANNASREHPCRVIAVAPSSRKISPEEEHPTFLDAEIRFGSDAGAGEIIVQARHGGSLADLNVFQSLHKKSSSTCLSIQRLSSFGASPKQRFAAAQPTIMRFAIVLSRARRLSLT